jgi:predicted RNase H-like HicB family nuclease
MTCEIRNQEDSLPRYTGAMNFEIEFEQEEDGRWIAEIPSLPGVMAYGASKTEAESKVEAMALRVIADRIERENSTMTHVGFAAA